MKITIFFLVASLFFINCFAQFKLEVDAFFPYWVFYVIYGGDSDLRERCFLDDCHKMENRSEVINLNFNLDHYEKVFILIKTSNQKFIGDLKLYNKFVLKHDFFSGEVFLEQTFCQAELVSAS